MGHQTFIPYPWMLKTLSNCQAFSVSKKGKKRIRMMKRGVTNSCSCMIINTRDDIGMCLRSRKDNYSHAVSFGHF